VDKAAVIAALDACLLPVPDDGPIDVRDRLALEDPFPAWGKEAA